jgi:hypothetical protein
MPTNLQHALRPLPDRPNLRHLKDQAKDLLKTGAADSLADAQFQIARLYGFASWPKLKAHVDSLESIGQLKQAIDTNNIERVKTLMTSNPGYIWLRLGMPKGGRSLG